MKTQPTIVFFKKTSQEPEMRRSTGWTADQLMLLKELYPNVLNAEIADTLGLTLKAVNSKANKLRLKKAKGFHKELYKKKGGNKGTFKKGQTGWNKGMKGLKTGGEAGYFKKGHTPSTTKPVGYVKLLFEEATGRIRLMCKVAEKKWMPLAHYVFTRWYGEIPKGMLICHKNKNPLDCRLENLECISKRTNWERHSPAPNLFDGFVLSTMISKTVKGEERENLKKVLRANPDLIELKRNILKLRRQCKPTNPQ